MISAANFTCDCKPDFRLMNVANWNLKVYPRFRGYSEGEYAEGCEDVSDDDACLAGAPSAASNLR